MSRFLVTIACAALAGLFAWRTTGITTAHPDFAVIWAAVQDNSPYDAAALKTILGWADYPAAFVYPPSALPLFGLFGLLPLRLAVTAWSAASGAAMAIASRSTLAPLLLLTPAALWALSGGQVSVMLGALLLGVVVTLDRPLVAAILLGLAATLKPQLTAIIALSLARERGWSVVLPAFATVFAATVLSAVWFGPDQWLVWSQSLPAFIDLHASMPSLRRNEIGPGIPLVLRIIVFVVGIFLTLRALKAGDPLSAFVVAIGCALVSSPHAMGYEFAMFAPALPALLARRGWSAPAAIVLCVMPVLIWAGLPAFPWRVLAVLALVLAAAVDAGTIPATAATRLTNATGERP